MATTDAVVYPETDGKPMAETQLHQNQMIRLLDIFRFRYRDQRVFVASDLLLYYEEGNPKRSVVPDVFVVKDCDPGLRRIYKLWEEGRVPSLVVEVTSNSTRRMDERVKPGIYQDLGIEEYVLYDPTAEYLDPPLQGFRLERGRYRRITDGADGQIVCRSLGVTCQLDGDELLVIDSHTGQVLPTSLEASEARYEALETKYEELGTKYEELAGKYEAQQAASQATDECLTQLEAELRRLRQSGDRK